jgi:hypothetical protein
MADRKPYVYMCGVPKEHCNGSPENVNAGLGGTRKVHSAPENAHRCHARWLVTACGAKQLGPREFLMPEDKETGQESTVMIIDKKSKFGAPLRNGKEGTRNMSNAKGKGRSCRSGNIV